MSEQIYLLTPGIVYLNSLVGIAQYCIVHNVCINTIVCKTICLHSCMYIHTYLYMSKMHNVHVDRRNMTQPVICLIHKVSESHAHISIHLHNVYVPLLGNKMTDSSEVFWDTYIHIHSLLHYENM